MDSNPKLTSFTLFPALPKELRLKIWEFTLPGPRAIGVQYRTKPMQHKQRQISAFTGWMSSDPPPILLSICHESRLEALKRYRPALGSHFHEPRVYVDFSIDTLRFGLGPGEAYLSRDQSWLEAGPTNYLLDVFLGGGYHGADDEEKIQRMIIDVNDSLYERRGFCWEEIREFRALKELTILAWDHWDDSLSELWMHCRGTLITVANTHPEWIIPKVSILCLRTGTNMSVEPFTVQ